MPFSATVLNVLIASPSDVPNEREAITESLYAWNALNSLETGFVLLPVKWESHSAPAMGDRPQGIINNQVVKDCDMLIGAFWTRLGSPTGVEDSGTVEEIKWFLKQNKPVMIYYSQAPVPFDDINPEQLQKLKDFKSSIRNKGIQEQYTSIDDLKNKLTRQLTIVLREVSVNTVFDVKAAKAAKNSDDVHIKEVKNTKDNIDTSDDSLDICLLDYTEKSFAVIGDSMDYSNELKELGGKWISLRIGKKGWVFSKKKLSKVSELFGLPPILVDSIK